MGNNSGTETSSRPKSCGDSRNFFLAPYRALDLTDQKGYMCGKILAGLGAEVIKVEPPQGDPGRISGPFPSSAAGSTRSLYWCAYNVNKSSITLNLATDEGRAIFKRLIRRVDFVIESFPPGRLQELGLGYQTLSEINPRLILTSITPYGQSGPYKDYKASDLVCWAGTGYMWLCGSENRAPIRIAVPQAFLHGGAEAAMGSLVALWHRQMTGQGQQVDVSIRESVMWECLGANNHWDLNQEILKREGPFRVFGPFRMRYLFKCKDGDIVVLVLGGKVGAKGQKKLAEWIDREGMANDFLRGFDWDNFDAAHYSDELARPLESMLQAFFNTKTKEELFAAAREMGFFLAPVNNVRDLLESPQHRFREFWIEVQHPELGKSLTYPGAPFKTSEVSWRLAYRWPEIGEDNNAIYQEELGLSEEEIKNLKGAGVI